MLSLAKFVSAKRRVESPENLVACVDERFRRYTVFVDLAIAFHTLWPRWGGLLLVFIVVFSKRKLLKSVVKCVIARLDRLIA